MSWHDLSLSMQPRGNRNETRIAVQKDDILILLSRELLRKAGLAKGDYVAVIVGRDEHAGLVRLEKRRPGYKLTMPRAGSDQPVIKIGKRRDGDTVLPEQPDKLPSTSVEAEIIDGGAIMLRLPWDARPAEPPPADAEPSPGFIDTGARGITEAARQAFPVQQKSLAEVAADEKPPIPKHRLKFLREEVLPVLSPLGRKITKTRDGSGLLLDGKPATLEAIVAEANRILREDGCDPIVIPAMAAE